MFVPSFYLQKEGSLMATLESERIRGQFKGKPGYQTVTLRVTPSQISV